MRRIVLGCLLLAPCAGTHHVPEPADLVFRGGTIHTANPAKLRAEAVAVRGGRIVFVGDSREADRWIGPSTKVVSDPGSATERGEIGSLPDLDRPHESAVDAPRRP